MRTITVGQTVSTTYRPGVVLTGVVLRVVGYYADVKVDDFAPAHAGREMAFNLSDLTVPHPVVAVPFPTTNGIGWGAICPTHRHADDKATDRARGSAEDFAAAVVCTL